MRRKIFALRYITLSFLLLISGCFDSDSTLEISTAFIDHAAGKEWYVTSGSGFYQLEGLLDLYYLAESDTQAQLESVLDGQFLGSFDISPDGQYIVAESYNRAAPAESPHFIIYDRDLKTVYKNEAYVNYNIYSPYRWSPDGKTISFAHQTDIILFDFASREFRTVATNHKEVVRDGQPYGTPTWSADSARLTYQTDEDEVVVLEVASGVQEVVAQGYQPAWSPDGASIAFHQGRLSDRKAMLYDVQDQSITELFAGKFDSALIWTPDSQYLLYKRNYARTIFGDLLYYSFGDGRAYDTGLKAATLRHGKVFALPADFEARLLIQPDVGRENPNRRE